MRQAITKLLGISCVILSLMVLAASLSSVEGASVPTVTVGGTPYDPAVTPDSKYVYVANFENVSVIDTATNKVVATVVTEKFPMGIAITPDGKYAYGTQSSDLPIESVISTATNTVVATITLEHTANGGIAITHDGKYVYLTNMGGWVMVVSTETNKVIENIFIEPRNPDWTDPTNNASLRTPSAPRAVAVSPDDKYAYIGTGDGRVIVIDVSTNRIVQTIELEVGIWDIALAPDGKHLYATTGIEKIFIIDTAANAVTATLSDFGSRSLTGIAITSDGNYAYVTDTWSDTVLVLNTATNTVDKTITVGQGAREVAFAPDGKHAYVTCDTDSSGTAGTVWVLSINGGSNLPQATPSTSENSNLQQATPQATPSDTEFPVQTLIISVLVIVVAISAGIIFVKIKPMKKQSTNTHLMLTLLLS
jgi:YVTN family beta-propeller protein